jgi:hypothetical protein
MSERVTPAPADAAALLASVPAPAGKVGWPWTEASARMPATMPGGRPWPRFTVVTPSYNQAEFLEETIRSVLFQGYPNLEYFVVDGGSADGSVEIIRRYKPWLARWVSQPDGGQAEAIRKGFGWAAGELLAWLNSDDIYAPGALATAARAFADRPEAVLIYGDANVIGRDSSLEGPAHYVRPFDRAYLLAESNLIAQPSAFFRRAAYAAAGGLDVSLHYVMDWDLWLRLEEQGPVHHLPEVLSSMRDHPTAKTRTGGQTMLLELKRMIESHGGRGLPAFFEAMVHWQHLARAFEAYRMGDFQAAQTELAFVVQILPGWQTEPSLLADAIAGQALALAESAEADDAAIEFAEEVCRHLPAILASPAAVRRRSLGLLYQGLALRSHAQGRPRAVRRYAWQAAAHDLGRLANRGLWSVGLKSLFASPAGRSRSAAGQTLNGRAGS